ncbi:MAG: efflux RND transporter permease subunit [Proteobacteria bacterium]|nr:efflux RND transporter permease subunit [Pseudomonadota bacterium]
MVLTRAAISRRGTVFLLMILIVVLGGLSYLTLPRESSPDITIPLILVQTTYEGAASEDVENLITIPLERKLRGLKDLKEVRSVSAEGASMIEVEFFPDVDISEAHQRVRDKVDEAKGELPGDLEYDPAVMEINLSEWPVLKIAVSGNVNEMVLKTVAEELEDIMEQIPGVLEVDVTGDREREIRVEFDPDRMAAYKLSFTEILSLVQRENVNVPGGSIDLGKGKYMLRIPGEFTDPSEIDNLVLVVRQGKPIYLKDVARIRDTFEDPQSYARVNGKPGVTLSVKKRSGENIISLADQVFSFLEEARPRLPSGVEFTVTLDEAKNIRQIVRELENNILTALVLVLVVLFVFLGVRSAVFVALAIPFSMLMSFFVLQVMGITLNMVVLISLIIALGMLVDNAIVMVENIYRHMESGLGRVEAACKASSEVGWPIIASTLTTLCAFGPLLFWPDIMGEFMKFLPMTLIIVLTSSLFVALVINPVLCAAFLRTGLPRKEKDHQKILIRGYRALLGFALRYRFFAVFLAVLTMAGVLSIYMLSGPEVELFPDTEPNRAFISVKAPQGTSLDTTDALVREVEEIVAREGDLKYVTGEVGVSSGWGSAQESRLGLVTVEFVDREERTMTSDSVLDRMRDNLRGLSGADINLEKERMGPPSEAPIVVRIKGEDVDVLSDLVDAVKEEIRDVPGLVDMEDDLSRAKPEIAVRVDREKATLLGLSTIEISNTIKAAVNGWKIGDYREGEDEYDIIARLPENYRKTLDQIANLQIPTRTGDPVSLATVASLEMRGGFGSIRHLDQKRIIRITAFNAGRSSLEIMGEVRERLASLRVPSGYSLTFGGDFEEQEKSSAFLSRAFFVALFLIFLVLLTQFNSLGQSFIVLSTVVLSLMGVLIGLIITGMPFGIIMTGIGVISLAGVVVNNAIVLIDYANVLRKEGMELNEALMKAGTVRFRPVTLTAVTTILGLTPMAIGLSIDFKNLTLQVGGESAQWWGPMAVAVIFGLTVATLLTLVMVPVFYSLNESIPYRGPRQIALEACRSETLDVGN